MNERGFTLVEIIAVLVIIAIIGAIAVPKFFNLDQKAKEKLIDTAIYELNRLETEFWTYSQFKEIGSLDYDLGEDYVWKERSENKGVLVVKGKEVHLVKKLNPNLPPRWERR